MFLGKSLRSFGGSCPLSVNEREAVQKPTGHDLIECLHCVDLPRTLSTALGLRDTARLCVKKFYVLKNLDPGYPKIKLFEGLPRQKLFEIHEGVAN